jgi:pyruvate/2-oxoglutarate dehydrogenase complex dihydrolipoamide dehydrogenase (E3) component
MPWVTFTDPDLAAFRVNEKQLKERNISYKKLEKEFTDGDRAEAINNGIATI